jgi:hypothetical protein
MAFPGYASPYVLTESELIGPIEISYDRSKTALAYDCFYIDGGKVATASKAPDTVIIDSARIDRDMRYKPIDYLQGLPSEYNYLYENAATANYYGQKRIDYYRAARIRVKCGVKGFYSGEQWKSTNLFEGKRVMLNLSTSLNDADDITNEPAIVISVNKDVQRNRYTEVVFELTNRPTPNL